VSATDPERLRYVLVVSHGVPDRTPTRSLLSSLPRVLVRGHHGLFLVPLFRAYQDAVRFRGKHLRHNPQNTYSAFYGLDLVKPAAFVRNARQLTEGTLLGDVPAAAVDVLGFEEVEWFKLRKDEVAPFFDYLDRVLPDVRFVLDARPLEEALERGLPRETDRDVAVRRIQRIAAVQDHLRATRGDRCFELSPADLPDVGEPGDTVLRDLAEFVVGGRGEELVEELVETLRAHRA
jgi:hypothetical protein